MKVPISIEASAGDALSAGTFFSIPLARGAFEGPVEAAVPAHAVEAVELWELGRWPDGSLRMVQGMIPRHAPVVEVEIRKASPAPASDDVPEEAGASFTFHGHELEWDAERKMYALSHNGQRYFDPRGFSLRFGGARGDVAECLAEGEGEGGMKIRKRGRWLRLETGARGDLQDGVSGLRFRLQWDLFAGLPGCVLSLMAIHDRPQCPAVELSHVEARLTLSAKGARHGVFQKRCGYELTESRAVETGGAVDVRVEGALYAPRVANFEVLGDENRYGAHLNPPPDEVVPVFWLHDGSRRLVVAMENMAFLRPKGAILEGGGVTLGIWPRWAGPLRWPQGRRRQVRVALGVLKGGGEPDFPSMQALTAALLDTQRATLPTEVYRAAGFFDLPWLLPCRADANPRVEGWIARASTLQTMPDFFDFGDTRDSHYTRTYYPLGRVPPKVGAHGPGPGLAITSGRMPFATGSMDLREPVFVNNEYDVLHCLASEALRSGNFLLFRQLGWFARHTIEVDFICQSDEEARHRAQGAHSVGHTSGGAYPSHFWTQGLAEYYFLTGDDDALHLVEALADKTIWYFDHPRLGKLGSGINREMGWAVLTLVSAYEATLKPACLSAARRLIDTVLCEPLPPDLPVFSFGHTSLLLGCKAYIEIVGRSDERAAPVREWYLAVVRLAIRSAWSAPSGVPRSSPRPKLSYDYEQLEKGQSAGGRPRPGVLDGYAALACLAYAWRLTGDRAFIEAGVRSVHAFLEETPGYFTELPFRDPLPEGKPFAVAYRSFVEFFAALEECGLLARFELPA